MQFIPVELGARHVPPTDIGSPETLAPQPSAPHGLAPRPTLPPLRADAEEGWTDRTSLFGDPEA